MSLNTITLQYSGTAGNSKNTSYPFRKEVKCVEDMREVAKYDHVCGVYADGQNNRGHAIRGYRSRKTFVSANCLPADCDNTTTDPLMPDLTPEQWTRPEDVRRAFPDVPFYVVYSRNHMKPKDGKPPRPKFHVYFITDETTSEKQLAELKRQVQEYFPAFDPAALDAARFLFGVDNPQVEFYGGNTPLNAFMDMRGAIPNTIPTGARNSTLSVIAAKLLKKYGDTEQAESCFNEAAERCEEPLEQSELATIWNSAKGFFHGTIEKDPNYLNSTEYAALDFGGGSEKRIRVTLDVLKSVLDSLNIRFRLNIITGKVEIDGMPEQYSRSNAVNTLPAMLIDYMAHHNMRCTRQALDDMLLLVEDENRYNPIEDMLTSTHYDGTDRLTAIYEILGVSGCERYKLYVRKWLHQCIAMALNDEVCPYGADGVLVIRADQGAGKTLFCSKVACRPEWFAEGVSIDLNNKDTIIQSTSVWIAELGELDSTLKREQSSLKAFITKTKDTYRRPYARAATDTPRRMSFCATVNPSEFLNDETGSRRWWVIEPEKINSGRLQELPQEWFMQLWAQVYNELYLVNPQGFRLTEAERAELEAANAKFDKPLAGEIEILDQLDWDAPPVRWAWCTVSKVKDKLNLKPLTAPQIGKTLKKLSDRDTRILQKRVHGIRQYLLPPLTAEAAGYYYYGSANDFSTSSVY